MTKTIKIPEKLFRHVEFDRASVNEEARTVELSISSVEPYERYFGDEILDHGTKSIRLNRLQKAAPLLFNHDRDRHLGRIIKVSNDGQKLTVTAQFSKSQFAEEKWQDVLDGILREASVGYIVHKMVLEEESDEKDTYRVTDWEPMEGSLVTIPADYTVGVGRDKATGEEKEISVESKKDVDLSLKNEKTSLNPEKQDAPKDMKLTPSAKRYFEADKGDNPQGGSPIDADKLRKEGEAAERKRASDIQALSEHFRTKGLAGRKIDTSKAAAEFIREGKSEREFRDFVMENTFEEVKADATPRGEIEVIGERSAQRSGNRVAATIGQRFVESESFKGLAPKIGSRRSISMESDVSILGIRGKVQMAQRAGWQSSDLASINVAPQQQLIALGMQRLTIMDLIAPGTTSAAAIPYPRENTQGTVDGDAVTNGRPAARMVGEGQSKPLWEPDLTTETANVKKVAIVTKVPDEMLADFPAISSYIDQRLPFMVDTETEHQLLYGDGNDNNLKGILEMSGVQTHAKGGDSESDALYKMLTKIRVNAFFEPDGYAINPLDWETIKLMKDDNDQYLAGGPFYIPYGNGVYMELNTLWGKPVAVTTAVTEGKPIAGAWKLGAQYFIREGMRIEMTNANEDDFRTNKIAVRAEHRLALAVYRPVAFVEGSGF